MLTFLYRLLARARKLDDVTLDMIGTFEEARAEAQSRGRWNYFVFGVREISGLLGSPGRISRAWWALIPGAGMVGLVIGAAAFYVWPASYTSETELLLVPPSIPQSLMPSGDSDVDRSLSLIKQQVLSSSRLRPMVETLGLYPHLRGGSKDTAIREIIKALRIERSGDLVRVAFTYRDYPPAPDDPRKAAQVTNQLTMLIIDENLRSQTNQIMSAVEFFKSRAEKAASTWADLNGEIRGISSTNPRFDRLFLDREMARKDYESLRQKQSEAEGMMEMAIRQKAAKMMVLDPAQVPDGPDVSRRQMELYGLGGGLLIGFFAAWALFTMRSVSRLLLTPEAAPSD